MMKANGASAALRAVAMGVAVMLALSLGFAALTAALVGGGLLPVGAMGPAACIVTVAAALLGALLCGKRAGKARLPLCLCTWAVYLLIVFVLRGLIFKTVGESPWVIPCCGLVGAIPGALLSSRQKRRRYS